MFTFADKHINPKDIELFWRIRGIIYSIDIFATPGFDEITCHILAEAVSKEFGLKHIKGYWKSIYEHSWCMTESGNIIDVYPIGVIGGPILVARTVCHGLYIESDQIHGDVSSDEFYTCVDVVVEQLRNFKLIV